MELADTRDLKSLGSKLYRFEADIRHQYYKGDSMLLKSCGRCGKLVPYGVSYCTECLPIIQAMKEEQKRKRDKVYNGNRDPRYTRFYNSIEWRTLSTKRLQDDGYRCVWCNAIATEVDHIVELKDPRGWDLRLDYDNLRSMCHACHDKRHGRFVRKGRTR